MLVSEVLTRYAGPLQDDAFDRVTLTQRLQFLRQALLALVIVRPDATATIANVALAGGVEQTLPDGGLRFLGAQQNMGADGQTPGKVITRVDMDAFNIHQPGWMADDPDSVIEHYLFDPETPQTYYTWPPVADGASVYARIKYSKEPDVVPLDTDIPAYDPDNTVLPVRAIFADPLVEYMLYLSFRMDDEAQSLSRSDGHFGKFTSLLGVASDKAILHTPQVRAEPYRQRGPKAESVGV